MPKRKNFIEDEIEMKAYEHNRQIKIPDFIDTGELPDFQFQVGEETINYPTRFSVPNHLKDIMLYYHEKQIEKLKKSTKQSIKKSLPNPERNLTTPENDYISWLKKYWTYEKLVSLIKIHLKEKKVNFSLLDWLCTNYSKEYREDSQYILEDRIFDIHDNYVTYGKFYLKTFFDSFAREPRIVIEFEDIDNKVFSKFTNIRKDCKSIIWHNDMSFGLKYVGERKMIYLITSVGQLNFMMWAYTNNIIDFCKKNRQKIKAHMRKVKEVPKPKGGRKRHMVSTKTKPFKEFVVRKVEITSEDIIDLSDFTDYFQQTRPETKKNSFEVPDFIMNPKKLYSKQ